MQFGISKDKVVKLYLITLTNNVCLEENISVIHCEQILT